MYFIRAFNTSTMETVFSQIPVIIPAIFVAICAVLVFVFGFKKPNPLPEFDKKLNLSESTKRSKKDKVRFIQYANHLNCIYMYTYTHAEYTKW